MGKAFQNMWFLKQALKFAEENPLISLWLLVMLMIGASLFRSESELRQNQAKMTALTTAGGTSTREEREERTQQMEALQNGQKELTQRVRAAYKSLVLVALLGSSCLLAQQYM